MLIQVHASEALLNNTMQQLSDLEASANSIRFAGDPTDQPQASTSTSATASTQAPPATLLHDPAPSSLNTAPQADLANKRRYTSQTKRRQLHSSLALPSTLHNFWYPAEFSAQLKKRSLIPIELFHEPWVLFRGSDGKAACVRDTCAHRACPLGLGQVVDGQVSRMVFLSMHPAQHGLPLFNFIPMKYFEHQRPGVLIIKSFAYCLDRYGSQLCVCVCQWHI